MEITVGLFLIIFGLAFVGEFVDASMGMGYGTILTPLLILMGFEPLVVVPGILISQAFGGLFASIFHQKNQNVSFKKDSKDLKIVWIIVGFGILATIFAALVALNIPKMVLKTYIGLLVLTMGIIILFKMKVKFTWKKIMGLGALSAFNKGLSGGGFGPVVTGGQMITGSDHKNAVGVTTMAEVPICITGFFTYLMIRTFKEIDTPLLETPVKTFFQTLFSNEFFQWELYLALILGSILVAPFAAFITKKIDKKVASTVLGSIITLLGIFTLCKTYFF